MFFFRFQIIEQLKNDNFLNNVNIFTYLNIYMVQIHSIRQQLMQSWSEITNEQISKKKRKKGWIINKTRKCIIWNKRIFLSF